MAAAQVRQRPERDTEHQQGAGETGNRQAEHQPAHGVSLHRADAPPASAAIRSSIGGWLENSAIQPGRPLIPAVATF